MFAENLALHQPAWQSNTLRSSYTGVSYTADLAVDGRYGGQCALSDWDQTVEWRVDLGAVKNIHHVLIHHVISKSILGKIYFKIAYDYLT